MKTVKADKTDTDLDTHAATPVTAPVTAPRSRRDPGAPRRLARQLAGAGMNRALDALALAETHHTGRRRNGDTEISHPVAVASMALRLLAAGRPHDPAFLEDAVITALLHDIREDHGLDDAVLRASFGTRPADAVALLTKTCPATAGHPGGAFAAPAACPIAALVKGCDRADNLATMDGAFSPGKRHAYAAETRDEILPMLACAGRSFPDHRRHFAHVTFLIDAALDAAGV